VTDAPGRPRPFGVETLALDLPPLVGAFSRRLHEAGVPMTPGRAADFARALTLTRPVSRRRLYWTARAVFLSDESQRTAFDTVFASVFGDQPNTDAFDPDDAPVVSAPADDRRTSAHKTSPRDSLAREHRGSLASSPPDGDDGDAEPVEVEVPLGMASDEERLGNKRFDALEPHELAQLYRLMSTLELSTPTRRTRRSERARHGQRIDMRRTLRSSLRTGGDPIRMARRRRRVSRRRLVMLCDISGSMEPYARAYLQFLTCGAGTGPNAEAFVFATRLTRLTRALSSRNPERAIQRAAAAAPDWSSGTRIGDALKTFNDRHGRRGMARGAVIVILSDGWERGDPALVGREMQRLARLAHRIVWVNPRVGASAFSAQTGGMVAALPYCDALVSGHSLQALGEVAEAIAAQSPPRHGAPGSRGRTVESAREPREPEPWASATPVAGSSVAMPSGHGPSRGNTTPGWVTDENETEGG
jgi:uncharacterized protein with von Willebrand factor type A (vWA) domain